MPPIFIDENVAVSPMLYKNKLFELASEFKAVVVLVEENELKYDIEIWNEFNVDVLWVPTRDYTAPQLLQLYHVVKWINENANRGKKTLIHCMGGKGRSGTIATAYLMYTKHIGFDDAFKQVRGVRRGAVETWEQRKRLETFEILLNVLPEPKLTIIDKIAQKYSYGRGISHASKVTELSLTMWNQLRGVEKLQLCGSILAAAAILHDIGVFISEYDHHKHTLKLIKENNILYEIFNENKNVAIAWTAYYHRIGAGDPSENKNLERIKNIVTWSAAILRVADALDHGLNQIVETLDISIQPDELVIELYCNNNCRYEITRGIKKSNLLKNLMKRKITFKEVQLHRFF